MININFDFEKLEKSKMKPIAKLIDYSDSYEENYKYYTKDNFKQYDELSREVIEFFKVYQWRRKYVRENKSGICPTLTANMGTGGHNVPIIKSGAGIRKISPSECWSLMGFSEDSYNKAAEVTSDAQLYKQAGNSIVVDVIEAILKELHGDTKEQINYFELCAGIGAVSEAYRNLGYNANLIGFSEVDKFADKTFRAVHGDYKNYGDMTAIDVIDQVIDVLSGGTPCQDYSVAGTGAGGEKGSGTRSSLLHDQSRIAIANKIPVVIWENVKNVESGKHKNSVEEYCRDLENAGYTNHKKVLAAVDFGIPQGRERVFIVSINEEFIKRRENEEN